MRGEKNPKLRVSHIVFLVPKGMKPPIFVRFLPSNAQLNCKAQHLPRSLCKQHLRVTPRLILALFLQK